MFNEYESDIIEDIIEYVNSISYIDNMLLLLNGTDGCISIDYNKLLIFTEDNIYKITKEECDKIQNIIFDNLLNNIDYYNHDYIYEIKRIIMCDENRIFGGN